MNVDRRGTLRRQLKVGAGDAVLRTLPQ